MASTAKVGPQDLPPKGGYAPFDVTRVKLRTIIGGRLGIAIFTATTAIGSYFYYLTDTAIKRGEIEMRSSRLAITPLLTAEKDRLLLKHMRRLRDEESDLMKNFPGWEVGTYFGEQIYQSLPDDTFVEPSLRENVAHSDINEYGYAVMTHMVT